MGFNVIITGATGMVGEGVLHECLQHADVQSVLVINRRSCGVQHPKLKEIIHSDFHDITTVQTQLSGYQACFFCLGVSSVGIKEDQYRHLTYDLTLHVAGVLSKLNPDMIFTYVSGAGTDSTEQGRVMWARVKGKTENDLMKLPFRKVYNFRPGYMHPTPGLKNDLSFYKYIGWMYPALRKLFPGSVSTLGELGKAMINCVRLGYDKSVLEVKDIVELASKN
ncbi:MAG: NAD-dependent epimerase/dehydratase family protein [Bacteroidetes bacterium]|nr:NAD-dependent epimerase/dehydratase family protein [Bacteroidota bacterium]